MKKNLFLFLIIALFLTSCVSNKYGIFFHLGQSESEILKELDGNLSENIQYRYEKTENKDNNRYSVIRVKGFCYDDMDFNTIRLGFKNEKLVYIQLRIHEKQNIDRVVKYLSDKFGEGANNKRHSTNNNLCVKYWGDMDSDFMCLEKCTEDYYEVHICSKEEDSSRNVYKKMVIGDDY